MRTFAGKGQGPGELRSIDGLYVDGDMIYAVDFLSRLGQVYSLSGEPLKRLWLPRIPRAFAGGLQITPRGWLYLGENRKSLMLSDFEFSQEQLFIGEPSSGNERNRDRSLYNPSPNYLNFAVDSVNGRVLVSLPDEGFLIRVFSLDTLKEIQSLTLPGTRTAFDEDYGMAKLEEFSKRVSHKAWGQKHYRPDFPEFFPAYSFFRVYPTGVTLVSYGNPLMSHEKGVVYLDKNFEFISGPNHLSDGAIVVGQYEDYFYISVRDHEGAISIQKIKQSVFLEAEAVP